MRPGLYKITSFTVSNYAPGKLPVIKATSYNNTMMKGITRLLLAVVV